MPTTRSSAKKAAASAGGRTLQPWTSSAEVLMEKYNTSLATGLDKAQVEQARAEHGWNELDKEEERSFWEMVLEQFDDPMVKILLVAAVISTGIATFEAHESGQGFSIDKFVEPIVIVSILVLNAAIGVYQESSAEASLEALKDMQPQHALVIRESHPHTMEARELVPGDVIKVSVGDKVPADCRIAKMMSTVVKMEQSALTGESVAVQKTLDPLGDKDDFVVQDKHNMLFSGTNVANGSCLAVVTATGMKTEIGNVQDQIREAAEATREEKTPLKQKLEDFSDQLQNLISAVCILVFLINIRQFVEFDPFSVNFKKAVFYFQIAVALAVAAIPEGLPTVITMCLALGTRKMARRNCIVRQLPSVETLGCTTIVCSDKTGTLTTNQMSVKEVVMLKGKGETQIVNVEGSSYNPEDGGADVKLSKSGSEKERALREMVDICSMCNESDIELVSGKHKHVGAPTEAALKVLVEKLMPRKSNNPEDVLPANMEVQLEYDLKTTLEFSRDRKSMSVICEKDRKLKMMVKGAPESILERSTHILYHGETKPKPLDGEDKKLLKKEIQNMSRKAWRCLAMAYKVDGIPDPEKDKKAYEDTSKFAQLESNLIFVGVVGMQDPPRLEVKKSIEECRQAGVRVMMITGDNQDTAEAIAKDIGLFEDGDDLSTKSFLGGEFDKLSHQEKEKFLFDPEATSLVFSRAEPTFKKDIVSFLKKGSNKGEVGESGGEIVAMTGDGVNDAPALKMADIGIAMGISGTEVAKEASDMVLADDNFSTIVAAIEEGRSIYQNMKAFIRYMISSNIGEVVSIFLTAALGFPEGMISVQLLWVNLVTDGPPATALGFNPAEPDVMKKPPRKANDALISGWAMVRFLTVGAYVGMATVGIFAVWFTQTEFMGIDLSQDGHKPVTLEMLMNWGNCDLKTNQFVLPSGTIDNFPGSTWTAQGPMSTMEFTSGGCEYFGREGKMKASTLSLSVLVVIEMMNALNALSEDSTILGPRLFSNPYLLLAIAFSIGLHMLILYVPMLTPYFDVVPLSFNEWMLVMLFSSPVIIIDEVLKVVGSILFPQATPRRKSKKKN